MYHPAERTWLVSVGPFFKTINNSFELDMIIGINEAFANTLETAQESVTFVATCFHKLTQHMWQKRDYLSVCIWFQKWAHLGPESNVPVHPQLYRTTISQFLYNFSPRMAPHFFGHDDSPSNLAESQYPPPTQEIEKLPRLEGSEADQLLAQFGTNI